MPSIARIKSLVNLLLTKTMGVKLVQTDWSEPYYRKHLTQFIDGYNKELKGTILDIGAGTWTWTREHYGSDNYTNFDQFAHKDVDVVGDLLKLEKSFPEKKFDAVFCFETFEHVRNPFIAAEKIAYVLKPGGIFIGSAPFRHELHGEEYGDFWRFTRQGWDELLSPYFTDIRIVPLGDPLIPHHYMVSAHKKK